MINDYAKIGRGIKDTDKKACHGMILFLGGWQGEVV